MKPLFESGSCVRVSPCHNRFRVHYYRRIKGKESQTYMSQAVPEETALRVLRNISLWCALLNHPLHIGWENENDD